MPRKPKVDTAQIKELEQRLAKAQRDLRFARAQVQKQTRANDTRAKIIIGAFSKEHAIRNPGSETQRIVHLGIKQHLVNRPRDRHLFADVLALWETPSQPDVKTAPPETQQPDVTEAAE